MLKMSPEKKDRMTKKLDKMIDFIEEFKECLEDGEGYDDYEYDEEMMPRRMRGGVSSMRGRYSRRGGY